MRVAVLELPARWGPPEPALEQVDRLLSEGRADLAIVPELALTGYVSPRGDFDVSPFAEPIDGPTTRAVTEMACRHDVHLVTPLVLEEGGHLYNAATVIGPNGLVASYRKRHLWFPETWATPGPSSPSVFSIGSVKITMAICYDGHFLDEEAADALSRSDLLVFTSAWVDDENSRLPLLASVARRYGISVANANWGPGVVRIAGQGGSCVLDAMGRSVASVVRSPGRADAVLMPRLEPQR
ncbi:MAG TPA: carbon-nitrogen hydrolase family protein [Labilithrix sp.]|nr:carbon-nitrogen hydrolase family protein [Labilithrix sp.]